MAASLSTSAVAFLQLIRPGRRVITLLGCLSGGRCPVCSVAAAKQTQMQAKEGHAEHYGGW